MSSVRLNRLLVLYLLGPKRQEEMVGVVWILCGSIISQAPVFSVKRFSPYSSFIFLKQISLLLCCLHFFLPYLLKPSNFVIPPEQKLL